MFVLHAQERVSLERAQERGVLEKAAQADEVKNSSKDQKTEGAYLLIGDYLDPGMTERTIRFSTIPVTMPSMIKKVKGAPKAPSTTTENTNTMQYLVDALFSKPEWARKRKYIVKLKKVPKAQVNLRHLIPESNRHKKPRRK